ncbi:MAG: YihY/virulence factor BrkB family protein [Gemmatimonadota bacterium]|nr:YihY/virulence factor BrkB family protein [Gemmatimonadota bacterium]
MAVRLPGVLATPLTLMWEAAKSWSKDDVPRLGASLAYYTLFSLAPILLIAIAIAGALFGEGAVRGEVVTQLDGLIGPEGAAAVQSMLEGVNRERSGALIVVVGAITFLLASTGAFLELQHALNKIFRIQTDPDSKIREMLKDRLQAFSMVLAIGFLLMVSLAISAVLAALSSWVSLRYESISAVWQAADWAISLGIITVLFAMIFRYLPDARLGWRDVGLGAFVTAILFTIGKQLIGLYLGRSSVASAYGAAGSVIVLLLWVYYSSQLLLFGAGLTRVIAARHGRLPTPRPYARRRRGAPPETE